MRVRSPEIVASVGAFPFSSSRLTVTSGFALTKLPALSSTRITGAVAIAIFARAPVPVT